MGRVKTPNGNFHGTCVFHFHGHFHRDEYKPKGLELVQKGNGTHIVRLGIWTTFQEIPYFFFPGNFPFGTKLVFPFTFH